MLKLSWIVQRFWQSGLVLALGTTMDLSAVAQEPSPLGWRMDFRRVTTVEGPKQEAPKVSEEEGVLLISEQAYELRLPQQTEAYSKSTKTLVRLDHTKKEHYQMPIHALVWFYSAETLHRNALCHAPEAAELSLSEMEPCSRFELESLLGYSHPLAQALFEGRDLNIAHQQKEQLHSFENDGKIAVRFEASKHALEGEHRRMFRRFLAHACRIHPDIRARIIEIGSVPSSMLFRSREGTTWTTVEYRFSNILFDQELPRFVVPDGYRPYSVDSRLEAVFERLEKSEIPSQQEFFDQAVESIDRWIEQHRLEEAVLAAHRFYVVTDSDQGLRELLNRCGGMSDRNVRRLVYGLANLREIKELNERLESSGSEIAYLLDYYLADVSMAQHRDEESIDESLLSALEKDPFLVGAYVDLWRRHMQHWDPYTAWRCIKAARRIAPNHSDLLPVNQMEKLLEVDSPDFF